MEPEVLQHCTQALKHLECSGATIEAVEIGFDLSALFDAWVTLRSFYFGNTNMALFQDTDLRSLLKPEAVWEIEKSLTHSGADVFKAMKVRSDWYRRCMALFESYDVLVAPATQLAPFPLEWDWPHEVNGIAMSTYHRWMEVVVPATMAGLPALSVPAGFTTGGLPVGLQLIGKPRSDWHLLQLGHRYDLASQYSTVRSPLLNNGR